ncbi:scarecrow-like 3 [Populus alba x Populus x berolinensis]|uniref:Scarecrow-like 3 n=1 Tax=Populus alba x Populus x berolinensis TaxID=444605 RepID=A0AAD6QUQ6_9ROSI|nr:scarecrow-like 3 [Populus alba x Populus x berolinensis]
MRTLAARNEGPPKLRITGLIDGHNLLELEASLKELAEEASSLGIRLEFNLVSEPVSPLLLTTENLNLREGEALFVNSIMHLHKFVKESRGSLKAILQAIKKLNPTLLTVVEQDANHNGPFFLGRFIESLHYYSAIFDSLEATYEGSNRIERHERADQWRRQLSRAGFQVMGLKCMSQARMMLSVYGIDGYTLATEKGCLLLGWKGRPLMLASAWQVHNLFPS